MMPDELMKLKFGEAIFMKSRMHPVKAVVKPIGNYPIKFKMTKLPSKQKIFQISCFNLDEFRKEKTMKAINSKVELE